MRTKRPSCTSESLTPRRWPMHALWCARVRARRSYIVARRGRRRTYSWMKPRRRRCRKRSSHSLLQTTKRPSFSPATPNNWAPPCTPSKPRALVCANHCSSSGWITKAWRTVSNYDYAIVVIPISWRYRRGYSTMARSKASHQRKTWRYQMDGTNSAVELAMVAPHGACFMASKVNSAAKVTRARGRIHSKPNRSSRCSSIYSSALRSPSRTWASWPPTDAKWC